MKQKPDFFVHVPERRNLTERREGRKGRGQAAYGGAIPSFDFSGILSVLLER